VGIGQVSGLPQALGNRVEGVAQHFRGKKNCRNGFLAGKGVHGAQILGPQPEDQDRRPVGADDIQPELSGRPVIGPQGHVPGFGPGKFPPALRETLPQGCTFRIFAEDNHHLGVVGKPFTRVQEAGGRFAGLIQALGKIQGVPVRFGHHREIGERKNGGNFMLFTEFMDRTPAAGRQSADKGEDRLLCIVIFQLGRPCFLRAMQLPHVKLQPAVGLVHFGLEERPGFGAALLMPALGVVGLYMGLQGGQHGLPVFRSNISGDHGGEADGRVIHSRRRFDGQVLEIVDQDAHVFLAEKIEGHDRIELAAGGVHAGQQHPGQAPVRIRGPGVFYLPVPGEMPPVIHFFRIAFGGTPCPCFPPGFVQFLAVGRPGDHGSFHRTESASLVAVVAGEHSAVHGNVTHDDRLHRFSGGEDALPVHLLAKTQDLGIGNPGGQHYFIAKGGKGGQEETRGRDQQHFHGHGVPVVTFSTAIHIPA